MDELNRMKKEGKIRAIDVYTLSNTGAYGDHGPTTVGLSGHKSIPLYSSAEAHRFAYDVVYTNHMAAGAYRGYGATQGIFAVESAVNEMAQRLHMDPVETRNEEVLQAKRETEKAVEALDPRCSIHDFRMVNGEKQINLIFDFVIPREYSEEKGNELTLTLMDRLQHHNPKYQCVITLDRSYVEEQR